MGHMSHMGCACSLGGLCAEAAAGYGWQCMLLPGCCGGQFGNRSLQNLQSRGCSYCGGTLTQGWAQIAVLPCCCPS